MTHVVHCKKESFDVYIGRPSKWGNPFSIGHYGTRDEVIARYRRYLDTKPELIRDAKKELRDKVLGCWCAPKACHGDVLAEIVNAEVKQ